MKILSPKVHGYLDFVVVITFALAPTIFGLTGLAATIAYVLAVVHLALTLATAFPLGVIGLVPFTIHGWIELLVSVGLVALPFIAGFSDVPVARNFYIAAGIVVFVTWLITNYQAAETATA